MQAERVAWLQGTAFLMTDVRILDERVQGLTYSYRVSLGARSVAQAVDADLKRIGRTVRIRGYRPGRAPPSLVRSHHGARVRAAAVDRMAISLARTLIEEKGLEPIRRPRIEFEESAAAPSGDVVFSLILEVPPEIRLGPLEGMPIRRWKVPEGDAVLTERANADVKRQLFDELMKRYDFPVPEDMVENEYDRIVHSFQDKVGEAVDTELDLQLRSIAERRIRLAILLAEIGRVHGIGASRAEIEALVEREADRDPAHQAEIIDYYLDHPMALAELQSPLFEKRVVDFLLERSEVEEVALSTEDLSDALGYV
jgi:FKBP-type peptidyl-prolyl cis-trans isomerase (trigger factor)